jgi:hypothetical protein
MYTLVYTLVDFFSPANLQCGIYHYVYYTARLCQLGLFIAGLKILYLPAFCG